MTDPKNEKIQTIKNKSLGLLIGIGGPILSFELFKYDELMRMALKFPNWIVGFFAGPMTGIPMGVVAASFPLLLAGLAGTSLYFGWRIWNRGNPKYQNSFLHGQSVEIRKLLWVLVMSIAIPIYTVILVGRASGSYFKDGLVPLWIEREFRIESLRAFLPPTLYGLFISASLVSAIFMLRFNRKLAAQKKLADELLAKSNIENSEGGISPGIEAQPVVGQLALAPNPATNPEPPKTPHKLFRLVLAINSLLIVGVWIFIKFYGRRGY